jgi:hypothetical protein
LGAVQVPTHTHSLTDNLSEPLRPTKTSKTFFKEHGINWREEKENEYLASKNGKGTG